MCPRPESDRDLELRRLLFYPLNYKDVNTNKIIGVTLLIAIFSDDMYIL